MNTLVAGLSIISNRKRVKIRFVRCPLSCHPLFQTLNWMTEPVLTSLYYFKPVWTSLNAFNKFKISILVEKFFKRA